MLQKAKESLRKVGKKAVTVLANEKGQLSAMAWTIGSAVVVVLIVVVFMALAPQTAQNTWNSFISYMTGKFGF